MQMEHPNTFTLVCDRRCICTRAAIFLALTSILSGANVNHTAATNRTLWPLDGGSVALDLHHPWTYVFINLGIGTDNPSFNISLTPDLLNVTGNGTYCLPKVTLPSGITPTDGQNASIMVATGGKNGVALYNVSHPIPGSR